MPYNGSQLYAGRDFDHKTSYEVLNSKFTTFLSYEARNPCLSIGDVRQSCFFFICFLVDYLGFLLNVYFLICIGYLTYNIYKSYYFIFFPIHSFCVFTIMIFCLFFFTTFASFFNYSVIFFTK